MPLLIDPVFGCELSTNTRDSSGYAYHGKSRAHIVAWERAYGPVPDGMEVEHLCRVRHCCAVHHLELVTRSENERRKAMAYRLRRATCRAGHSLRESRVLLPTGGIVCRLCNRDASERRSRG